MAQDKNTNKALTVTPEELAEQLAKALEENAALKNDNEEKVRQIERATAENERLQAASSGTVSEEVKKLQEAGNIAAAQLKELQDENAALKATNEGLNDKLGLVQSGSAKAEVFKYEGKKYQILYTASIPGLGKRTPLDITQDKEAQQWLVENNSGLIKEIK